jgi:hypothetical protein
MKGKTAGIACILVLIGAWVYVHAQPAAQSAVPAGSNGRYQVVAADIDSEGMGGNLKHKTAIRVDTQTGKAWSLDEIEDKNGGGNFYWVPLQEIR